MSAEPPPPVPPPNPALITPDHLGPKVDITIWICFVISGLAVTAKVLTKLGRSQRHIRLTNLELDDFVLLASWAFAAGYTIAVSRQVDAGLGDHIAVLPRGRIESYEKAGFASQILYICTLMTAKSAACLFAMNLQPHSRNKMIIYGLIGTNALWGLISIFSISFQCKVPHTYAITSDKCFNQPAFWTFVEVVNAVTDIALVGILCAMVWTLQVSKNKIMLLSVFAARVFILIPIIFRLVYIYRADVPHGSLEWDPTSKEVNVAIATAVVLNTSLVLTCVPFLKPLMEQLQPGWSTNNVVKGVGYNMMYGKGTVNSGQYPMGSVVSGQSKKSNKSAKKSGVQEISIQRTDMFTMDSRNAEKDVV